jgi:hypothetical protein
MRPSTNDEYLHSFYCCEILILVFSLFSAFSLGKRAYRATLFVCPSAMGFSDKRCIGDHGKWPRWKAYASKLILRQSKMVKFGMGVDRLVGVGRLEGNGSIGGEWVDLNSLHLRVFYYPLHRLPHKPDRHTYRKCAAFSFGQRKGFDDFFTMASRHS